MFQKHTYSHPLRHSAEIAKNKYIKFLKNSINEASGKMSKLKSIASLCCLKIKFGKTAEIERCAKVASQCHGLHSN